MSNKNTGWLIVLLGALTALGPLSIDMYLPAFGLIGKYFHASDALMKLSLATFFLGLALGQILYGSAADRYGRKPPLYVGLTLYLAATLGCLFSPTAEVLVGFRFFQGLGACAGAIITRAAVRDLFEREESARVFSWIILVMGAAPVVAPIIGGFLSTHYGWHMIFVVLSVAAALALIGAVVFLPETRPMLREERKSPDVGKMFRTFGQILGDRSFLGYALPGALAQAGMFAYISGSPEVYLKIFGLSPQDYSIVFAANAAGLIFSSQLNRKLLNHFSLDGILKVSFTLVAFVSVGLAIVGDLNPEFWTISTLLFLFLAFLGTTFPNSIAGALANQGGRAGSATAMLGILQYGLAGIASVIVSQVDGGSAVPMTATMAGCAVSAAIMFLVIAPHKEMHVESGPAIEAEEESLS